MSTTFDNKKQEEILKRDGLGRLRTSRERREAILDDFEASAMSGVGYARAHGIKYTTFANWIQKRRRERGDYGKAEPPAKAPVTGLTLAEVVVKNPPPPGNRQGNNGLRVELPGGAVLFVDNASQATLAAELVRLVNQSK